MDIPVLVFDTFTLFMKRPIPRTVTFFSVSTFLRVNFVVRLRDFRGHEKCRISKYSIVGSVLYVCVWIAFELFVW